MLSLNSKVMNIYEKNMSANYMLSTKEIMDGWTILSTAKLEDMGVLFFVFCSDSLAKLTQGQLGRLSQDSGISCFQKKWFNVNRIISKRHKCE